MFGCMICCKEMSKGGKLI